jgi:protein SCO1/2
MKKIPVILFILAAALLLIVLAIPMTASKNKSAESNKPVASGKFGGPFTLVDQDGTPFTDKDLEGQYALLYFGFTYCPAICPTELAKMANALDQLGTDADSIKPIFITVDPERDTADVMKGYVTHFHPRLMGLTGTVEQIEQAKKAYKVYAAKVEDPSLSDYTMDHSSYIYFLAPDGALLSLFKTQDTAEDMVTEIKKWISKS